MAEDVRIKLNKLIEENKDKNWGTILMLLDEELSKENIPEEDKRKIINDLKGGFKTMKKEVKQGVDYSDIKFIWIKDKLTKKGYVSVLTKNYGYTEDEIRDFLYELDSAWIQDMSLDLDIAVQERLLKGNNKNKWEKLINELKDIEQEVMTYVAMKTTNDHHDKKVAEEQKIQMELKEKALKQEKAKKKKTMIIITAIATAAAIAIAGICAYVHSKLKPVIERNKLEKQIVHELVENFKTVYEDGAKPLIGTYTNDSDMVPNNIDWEEFERDVDMFIETHKPLLKNQNNELSETEKLKKEIILSSIEYGNEKYGNGNQFSKKAARVLRVDEDLTYQDFEDYVDMVADEREGKGAR